MFRVVPSLLVGLLLAAGLSVCQSSSGDAAATAASASESQATPAVEAAAPAAAPAAVEGDAAPPTANAAAAAAAAPPPGKEGGDDVRASDEALAPQNLQAKADLEQRLKALDNAGLSDDDKRRATEYYQQALEAFDVASQHIETALKFDEQLSKTKAVLAITRDKAKLPEFAAYELTDEDFDHVGKDIIEAPGPQSTKSYSAKLAKPLLPYEDVSNLPLEDIEKRCARVETSLDIYRQHLAEMEAEPKRRSQRMAELPKQISETQQKHTQLADELASLGSEEVSDVTAVAHRAALAQGVLALEATLQALEREQRLYQDGGEWVKVRRDYFARYVPYKEKRLAQLRQVISQRRVDLAQQQARQAAEAAQAAPPETLRPRAKEILAELANENQALAAELPVVAGRLTTLTQQLDDAQKVLRELQSRFDRAQDQVKPNELSEFSGLLLRQQQAELPNLRELRRRNVKRESERSNVLIKNFELNDADARLANLDDLTEQTAVSAGDLSDEFRTEVRTLLDSKREILEALLKNYEQYSLDLNELDTKEAELIATTESYGDFIAERVLWIRSCAPPQASDWRAAAAAAAWSLDVRNWRDAGAAVLASGVRQPARFALFVIALVLLAAAQRPARQRLADLGGEAEKRNCIKLAPTFHALWLTIVLALPWPALLAFLGWTMDSLSESEFVRALSLAIRFAGVCLLLLEIVRHLCRAGGLADAHFNWPQACLTHLRRRLRWLTALGLPLVWWLVGLEVQSLDPKWSSSLGRASFVLVMLLLAGVFHRILMAPASPYRQVILYSERGWLKPLQLAWRPAIVTLPVALAALSAVGYYYTAQQAAVRLLETVAMLLAVLTLGGLTRRWLLVNRRRLAREQAKQRRAQLAAVADADSSAPPPPELAEEAVDLAALSEQTQKLVRTFLAMTTAVGLVVIWAEILPALAYPAARLLPGAVDLTWGHLGTFMLVLAVTFISVRDIPALLELVVLQHLPLDSGARYAFTSVSRYILTAIGLTAAFNAVLIEWGDIQWLVAAMSVGLGFGLQEIFANFVSGIILLFERPIRVGDIVTLGEKSGVVSRIRMRATTIVDWDRKEYIVPNKDLVTGRLLNWTLSDQMNRIEILLMVSHGADTDQACEVLLESAREESHVLAEPSPSAVFEGFTESGLKLALRCFLPTLEHRGATIHRLHSTIDRKLRAAGIEVASPTKEMRVRVAREGRLVEAVKSHLAFGGKSDAAFVEKSPKRNAS